MTAIRRAFLAFLVFISLYSSGFGRASVLAQGAAGLSITAPQSGQVVQGLTVVTGSVDLLGFSYYELAFAYQDDPTGTWFILQTSSNVVSAGELGVWDTSTLTDGDYNLRLRAWLLDGSMQETIVTALHVRNYTAMPTSTSTPTETPFPGVIVPTALLSTPVPAAVAQAYSTPTPLPVNPASLSVPSIYGALRQGALLSLALFLALGLLLRLRRN